MQARTSIIEVPVKQFLFYKSELKLLITRDIGSFLRHALELLKFISFHLIQLTNGLLLRT